jgi:hypothetical protein
MDNDRSSTQQNFIADDMGDPEIPTTEDSQNAPQVNYLLIVAEC